MDIGKPRVADATLYRRGEVITGWARALSVGLALVGLSLIWGSPRTRPGPALLNGCAYIVFALWARAWAKRHPESRGWLKMLHNVADAVAVGVGAAFSGGLESPIWLLLYAHVVAVSVRGGLGYAMAMGTLDALIVAGLAIMTPAHPEGILHVLALLFCAFTGGTTSSYLHKTQRRLFEANRELHGINEQLKETAALARRMEDEARGHLHREKRAYQRLEELDRLRSQYLNNVSHEFRTPLTVIRGYGEHLMNEGPPADGSLPDVMRVIVENCDQIIDMVDTLIEVSRIEQEGERSLEVRLLDLRDLVTSSVDPLRLQAAKKRSGADPGDAPGALERPGRPVAPRPPDPEARGQCREVQPCGWQGGGRGAEPTWNREPSRCRTPVSGSRPSTSRGSSTSSTWWTGASPADAGEPG